jgi:hypothetical protein
MSRARVVSPARITFNVSVIANVQIYASFNSPTRTQVDMLKLFSGPQDTGESQVIKDQARDINEASLFSTDAAKNLDEELQRNKKTVGECRWCMPGRQLTFVSLRRRAASSDVRRAWSSCSVTERSCSSTACVQGRFSGSWRRRGSGIKAKEEIENVRCQQWHVCGRIEYCGLSRHSLRVCDCARCIFDDETRVCRCAWRSDERTRVGVDEDIRSNGCRSSGESTG